MARFGAIESQLQLLSQCRSEESTSDAGDCAWVARVLLQRHKLRDRPTHASEFDEERYPTMASLRMAWKTIKQELKA